jgi:hypothetical protein
MPPTPTQGLASRASVLFVDFATSHFPMLKFDRVVLHAVPGDLCCAYGRATQCVPACPSSHSALKPNQTIRSALDSPLVYVLGDAVVTYVNQAVIHGVRLASLRM